MSQSTDIALLKNAWEAMSAAGDLSLLKEVLAPEATWQGVEDGQGKCENRQMILAVMERNRAGGLVGRVEEMVEIGNRIFVGFRPDRPREDGRPLDQGIAYVVVTMSQGKVIELKGCADRAAALGYAQGAGS